MKYPRFVPLLLLSHVTIGTARSVEFSLTADWPTWPLSPLQETAEYLSENLKEGPTSYSSSLFWSFLDNIRDSAKLIDEALEDAAFSTQAYDTLWALALAKAGALITPLDSSLLHLYLGSRAYAPALEWHRSMRKALQESFPPGCGDGGAASFTWAVISPGPEQADLVTCSPEGLRQILHEVAGNTSLYSCSANVAFDRVPSLSIHRSSHSDHVYPLSSSEEPLSSVVVTLYAPIGTSGFYTFHSILSQQATEGRLKYIVRHFVPDPGTRTIPTALQGYGIFLDIKNMEYKNLDESSVLVADAAHGPADQAAMLAEQIAEDDEICGLRFPSLIAREIENELPLRILRARLLKEAEATAGTSMKVWRMRDLGLQTAQTIVRAKDPLRKLQQLVQDFPSHASYLSTLTVADDTHKAAMTTLQLQILGAGSSLNPSAIYVNGQLHSLAQSIYNIHTLISAIRTEAQQLHALTRLPMPLNHLQRLIQLGTVHDSQSAVIRVDIYRKARGALFYLNNLEKDSKYLIFPPSLSNLLFPTWQLVGLRKNLYTMTLVVDPTRPPALRALAAMAGLYERSFPIRFSVLLTSESAARAATFDAEYLMSDAMFRSIPNATDKTEASAEAVAMLYREAKDAHGLPSARQFLFELGFLGAEMTEDQVLSFGQLLTVYSRAIAKVKGEWKRSTYTQEGWQTLRFLKQQDSSRSMLRLIVERNLPLNSYVMNGIVHPGLDIEQSILPYLGKEQATLTQLVAERRLTDHDKVLGVLTKSGKGVYGRYHQYLDEDRRAEMKLANLLRPRAGELLADMHWLWEGSGGQEKVSVILAVDLGRREGVLSLQRLLKAVLLKGTEGMQLLETRIAVLYHPVALPEEQGCMLQHLCRLPGIDLVSLDAILSYLLSDSPAVDRGWPYPDSLPSALAQPATEGYHDNFSSEVDHINLAREVLDIPANTGPLLVLNGRQIPLGSSPLDPDDLDLILQVELSSFPSELLALVSEASAQSPLQDGDAQGGRRPTADLLWQCRSFLLSRTKVPRVDVQNELRRLSAHNADFLVIQNLPSSRGQSTGPEASDPVADLLQLTVLLDPLTDSAQRIAPLLLLLRNHLQMPVTLVLAPFPEVTDFPLKNYYRFSIYPTRETNLIFTQLPSQHVLTTRVDVPEPWNVQIGEAEQDLDNLQCDSIRCGDGGTAHTRAHMTLKTLLIAGQCYNAVTRSAVNGLQLQLVDATSRNSSSVYSDTIVMQTLGYFQLKAQPGLWTVELAGGRSREAYELVGEAGQALLSLDGGFRIAKSSFVSAPEQLRVRARGGGNDAQLIDNNGVKVGEQGNGSRWGRVTEWFQRGGGGREAPRAETVHVFSLATGHLYERMLKIMMLSVSKRTSVPVIFWLLENFLSPAFKQSASVMAARCGFEVRYVTYKWPEWLRQQKEKQRIIWGYKILFLDVLFPLDVKKVIYVDADQVIRADLKELWDLNLQGCPYAYTPFCSSREETLGFQFWRSGYWKDHLGDLPYHISALYVVDLERFRSMGVGDKLRILYDQLSRDPGSLSNLDQDLPNYAQHQVPIFSLPQEWLWCESWCSDESKARAKTIDLCNNPRFKEPKLDMAKRVISGPLFNESWAELDQEVRRMETMEKSVAEVTSTARCDPDEAQICQGLRST